MNKTYIFLFIVFILFLSSCQSLKNIMENKNKKYTARLIIDLSDKYEKDKVVRGIEYSLSYRCDIIKNKKGFPKKLLEQVEKTIVTNRIVDNIGNAIAVCKNAWIEMYRENVLDMLLFGTNEKGAYKVCIYPYKFGYRVYIYANFKLKRNIIGNILSEDNPLNRNNEKTSLIKKISKSSKGLFYICEDRTFNCWFDMIFMRLEEVFPDLKIISAIYPQKRKEGTRLFIDKYK